MPFTIPPEYEEFVRRMVASGRYADAAAVLEDALLLLDERDRQEEERAAIAATEQVEP
jgi:putative addiction module CopG family antidote